MRLRCLWLALVFTAVATSPVLGQRAFELSALYGYYRPTGRFDPPFTIAAGLAVRPQDLSGAAVGGEARLWLVPHWGIGIEGATAGSRTPDVATPGGMFYGAPARVTSVSARVMYDLLGPRAPARLWLGVGPALVSHGGSAYSRYGSPTGPGFSAAWGASVRLSSHLRATAGASATVYDFQVNGYGKLIQSAVRKDVLLHAGLAWGTP